MTTVYLVDGTFELFRAYFGAPPAENRKGEEVGAVRGLFRSLVSLLNNQKVTHIGCAFDHVIESFRNRLFDGYKTGEGIDPDLFSQFPLAEQATEALGIATFAMVEFEADDALSTAAAALASDPSVEKVVICSPDKDLCQCVIDERVITWDRVRGKTLDRAGVEEKFGVEPASIPDYLALVGDSADGIPGVPRWGKASAATLLHHYKKLEQIPDDADTWPVKVRGARALAESLARHRKQAALYKTLATLRLDVPIDTSLEALAWTGAVRERLDALSSVLDDARLGERVSRFRT